MNKYRDLSYMKLSSAEILWVACDSAGGIGNRDLDIIKCPAEVVGYFTARVALLELLCVNAEPFICINNLCVSMNPDGKSIIKGINNCFLEMDYKVEITGSTEENFIVSQTALGLTMLGKSDKLIEKKIFDKAICFSLGIPMIGNDVLNNKDKIANLKDVRDILLSDKIIDSIPVGSKGIEYELSVLNKDYLKNIRLIESVVDIKKSAGPSTCVLFLCGEEEYNYFKRKYNNVNIIGILE